MSPSSPLRVLLSPFTTLSLSALLIGAIAAAPAGPLGEWTRITELTGTNSDEVALARTPNGVLHIAWLRKNGTQVDLVHTAVDSTGRPLGAATPILTGWSTISHPVLLTAKDAGLRVFFSGIRSTAAGEPYSGSVYTASAPAAGDAWALAPGGVMQSKNAYASPPAATLALDGTPIVASSGSGWEISLHSGLSDTDPDRPASPGAATGCCLYDPALATDATGGEVVLAWYSNISKAAGLFAQTVAPSAGARLDVPGSTDPGHVNSIEPGQRVALTARPGAAGVYLAYCAGYPSCQSVNLWRHGTAAPLVVARAAAAEFVNAAAAPEGRLWVMWAVRQGGPARVFATRSNRAATQFGPIVSTAGPAGTSTIWKVAGEGSLGPLDLLTSCTTPQGLATWHTRLLPALTLTSDRRSFSAGDSATVVWRVSDAGDPVPGATVAVGDRSGTTDQMGRFSITFPATTRAGTIAAHATLQGYVAASASVTVTTPPPTKPARP